LAKRFLMTAQRKFRESLMNQITCALWRTMAAVRYANLGDWMLDNSTELQN